MSEERMKILEMLSDGKISAAEADELLRALEEPQGNAQRPASGPPRYLRVQVEEGPAQSGQQKVNIRVPLQILRSGVRLASLLPEEARAKVDSALQEKGVQLELHQLRPQDVESLIESLGELSLEVHDEKDRVRIFCE